MDSPLDRYEDCFASEPVEVFAREANTPRTRRGPVADANRQELAAAASRA